MLTDGYYIPQLCSSIISVGQLDEHDSEVLIKECVLRIKDREQRLLAKVKRSHNRLYLLYLKVEQPVCLQHGTPRSHGCGMSDLAILASTRSVS